MRSVRFIVDKQAKLQPDKVFMFAPEPQLELTFGQIKESSIKLGKQLLKRGIKKGDRVSLFMGNGYQPVKIFVGAMYSGLVVAPLNVLAQPSQLAYILGHAEPKLVFVTEQNRQRLEEAVGKASKDIQIMVIDKGAREIFPDEDLAGHKLPTVKEDDPAILLYTSGTTGVPKGVILTHKNMVAGGENVTLAHSLTPEDRGLVSLAIYHINAEIVSIMGPLVSGSSIVVPEKFSVTSFWPLLSEYHCTWLSVVPTIVSYLVSGTDIEGKGYDLSRLRFGRSASAPLPPSLQKEFEKKFRCSIVETMGITETAAPIFSNPLDPAKRKIGSPGQPVGCQAKIIDRQGNEVPRRTPGEILIKGDCVMKEYYKDAAKTAEALDADGWFHTGDLGYLDEDNFVFVTGRLKELIIKGGENIAPREIDECFYLHPAIQDAAAVGIPDKHYGEEIMVCYTLRPDCSVSEPELREHCLHHLGRYKTPKLIIQIEELPKGPSGKVQRLKLKDIVGIES
ncbi:MAG: AMP-binding protein [Desulfobaccales bacterium]